MSFGTLQTSGLASLETLLYKVYMPLLAKRRLGGDAEANESSSFLKE